MFSFRLRPNPRPWLVCDRCGEYTEHHFVQERQKMLSLTRCAGYVQMYACDQCASTRRWGFTHTQVMGRSCAN